VSTPDRHSLVLIGAGSAVFTRGLLADLISADDLGAWDIRLVDIDSTALGVAVRLAEQMVHARNAEGRITVQGSVNRREVLPGAEFVVTCVGVGGREGWLRDHETCMAHGIFQPVGDSVMPGGISRLLRTVPVMVEVAKDIVELAPEAFFFNYSNPMTANVAAMTKYAGASVVGLCHGMHHVQRELAEYIGAPFEQTSTLYAGINHLTFIYDFRWNGSDAWPLVAKKRESERAGGTSPDDIGHIFNEGVRAAHNPFSWSLYDTYGAYPAANDRHVTEFFPQRWPAGAYYGKTLGVDAFSVPEILEWGQNRYLAMKAQADGEAPLDESIFDRSTGEQEQLIAIIRSVLHDSRQMFSVNMLNGGCVPGLPADAALEIPGVATGRGLRPVQVPDLSAPLTAILAQRVASVTLATEAAMTGDRSLVVEAIMADGSVTDPDRARRLTMALLQAQADYLPLFA
jgi:alpha-galactosidase